ncbi:T9SS type A sorting domain-containing protein [Winogradskyella sp. R77965]|uniref:T9SS type A sorting domain-containing protein n=1 Tax=Winogradskyella sp. R77965 TaxID=3093872 RepID=UPI0037DCDE51
MKKTTLLFTSILSMMLAIQTVVSQTEFQLDSIQSFAWDINTSAFEMNEREHFTYDNGGTKPTFCINYIDDFTTSAFDWIPETRLFKTYNEFNNIILEVGDSYDPVFDVWYEGDESEGLYYEYDALQNNTAIGWGWHGSDPDFLFTYNSDNLVVVKTERFYNSLMMGMNNLNQTLTSYNGLQKAEEIYQIWHNSTSTWSDEEKTEYTYNGDLPIQEDTYFWMGSDWATQAYKRQLNTYTSDQLTEKIIQEWNNGLDQWENAERKTWTIDNNDNIQEIQTYTWDNNTSTWLNDEQELWYWSEAGELLDLDQELNIPGKSVHIVPNPADSFFTIVGLSEDAIVTIYTASGHEVLSQHFPNYNQPYSVDIGALPSGLYIVGINSFNSNLSRKLIINN